MASLTFSSDGTLLVAGGHDNTVSLWDMQTGGLVKTLHTEGVSSVSISLDCTMIASGSQDKTIFLWDTRTGDCCCVIDGHNDIVNSVSFSPTNPQLLISASEDNTVRWWDINGVQISPTYSGNHVATSSDGTHFVSWMLREPIAVVQNSNSGVVIVELQDPSSDELPDDLRGFHCCDFSPDGKFVAGSGGATIYVWDITNSEPCLVGTFIGHVDGDGIQSIAFSSYLISLDSLTTRFRHISASSVGPVATDSESVPPTLAPITAINLQTNDGIALSGDSAGVVKSWDISTGICKESFYTPAKDLTYGDMQLINGRLILVWISDGDIYIWDSEKGELPQLICTPKGSFIRPRISGDGSMVLFLGKKFIQAWSVRTGRVVSEVSGPLWPELITTPDERLSTVRVSQYQATD